MRMEIVIANDTERENLFAEVHAVGQAWAEVIYDDLKRCYVLTLFSERAPDRGWIALELDAALEALVRAKARLIERGYPEP
jgi:hypothetical protein